MTKFFALSISSRSTRRVSLFTPSPLQPSWPTTTTEADHALASLSCRRWTPSPTQSDCLSTMPPARNNHVTGTEPTPTGWSDRELSKNSSFLGFVTNGMFSKNSFLSVDTRLPCDWRLLGGGHIRSTSTCLLSLDAFHGQCRGRKNIVPFTRHSRGDCCRRTQKRSCTCMRWRRTKRESLPSRHRQHL